MTAHGAIRCRDISPQPAVTATPELMKFIDACHAENIGIILDFVPVHFVRDFYALHIYDGSFLFESDNEYDRYSEWGTALFDYTKPHVLSFVKSSVNFWIENIMLTD